MLTANSEGNTDVANLTGGAALQKDPWSTSTRRKRFKDFIKSCKGKFFQKSSLKISKEEYHPNPSHAQKEAGNYKKAHVKVQGFDISVENPKGSYRRGKDSTGKEWKCKMVHHYGYFKRTEGSDGDHIDCFIGPNTKSELVYIINQIRPTSGQFDEHKVMLGFNSLNEAIEGYLANYSPGWKGLGDIQSMTVDQFRTWLEKADTTKKAKEVIIKSGIKFEKSQKAQVGETRTWNDGKVHRKTDKGWVEVSGNNRPSPKENPDKSKTGKSDAPQKTTYEQKAVEAISRWKEFEEQAKIKNKERIAKMKPEERNKAFDIKNASPGDIVRVERPIGGRVNRGHLAKVLDKIDGHLKVMLPSGGIFLFQPGDLAFAKSSKKNFWDNLIPFFKGKLAQVGEIRTWSDGNKYRKESNGWRMVGESENKAVHQTDLDSATKAGLSRAEHRAGTEKAMQNGEKIPVKVLREYPTLLDKYPQYKARVSAIDSISKGLQKGEKVGKEVEETANTLKSGKIPTAINSLKKLKKENLVKRQDASIDANEKSINAGMEKQALQDENPKSAKAIKALSKLKQEERLAAWGAAFKEAKLDYASAKTKGAKAKAIENLSKIRSEMKEKFGKVIPNIDSLYSPKGKLKNAAKKALKEKNGQDIQTQLKIAEAEAGMDNPPELIPQKGMWQDNVDGLPEQTWQIHFDGDPDKGGKPNPERQALHDKIMSDYLSKIPSVPEGEQPIVIMMMGGPASGKSSMVRALGIDESRFVVADADAVKERIPEYRVGVRSRARKAAAMAHEESSYLVKKIRADAMANRKNLVIDGTGAKAKSYLDAIPELRKQGYRIQLLMADCDVDIAVPRAIERAEKVGRFVPENFIRDAYPNIPNSFKQISPLVDDFHVFDTGNAKAGEKPKALYSKSNGQTIEHDARWVQRFLE